MNIETCQEKEKRHQTCPWRWGRLTSTSLDWHSFLRSADNELAAISTSLWAARREQVQ